MGFGGIGMFSPESTATSLLESSTQVLALAARSSIYYIDYEHINLRIFLHLLDVLIAFSADDGCRARDV